MVVWGTGIQFRTTCCFGSGAVHAGEGACIYIFTYIHACAFVWQTFGETVEKFDIEIAGQVTSTLASITATERYNYTRGS